MAFRKHSSGNGTQVSQQFKYAISSIPTTDDSLSFCAAQECVVIKKGRVKKSQISTGYAHHLIYIQNKKVPTYIRNWFEEI